MAKVMIAIPNVGNMRVELAEWCMTHDPMGHEVMIYSPTKSQHRPISVNRKFIIKEFLETDFDYLVQIDSDMAPPKHLLALISLEKDIISPAVRTFKGTSNGMEIVPLCMENIGGGEYKVKSTFNTLTECDAIGTGIMICKREVLEQVEFPHVSEDVRAIDFEFCDRAREAGFSVWYHGGVHCRQFTIFPV